MHNLWNGNQYGRKRRKESFSKSQGDDKNDVKDYQKTLELLGYDRWLDEDAMPAGTTLERGLLKGMQESCGVVFFLTPSFKDDGYLETGIDYAVTEKRKKGDKFAIIVLQFTSMDGRVGDVPELLKKYVWKKPKTPLEALREIVRALPVSSKLVDWRASISGVVTTPIAKSTSTQLSLEARTILREALLGDGRIMHLRFLGGEKVQTNGKSLIPDKQTRSIALWIGGLEDLRRRRFVKDVGHKGEVFEVTREGYEAADSV